MPGSASRFDYQPERAAADTAYGSGSFLSFVRDHGSSSSVWTIRMRTILCAWKRDPASSRGRCDCGTGSNACSPRQIPSRFRPTSPPRTARCRGGGFDRCDGPQPHSRHPVTRAPCPNASVTAHGRPDQPHVLDQSRDTNVRLVSARGSLNGRLEGGRSRLPDDL